MDTPAPDGGPWTIGALLAARARTLPRGAWLVAPDGGASLTAPAAIVAAERIVARLESAGVGPGDRVGLVLSNGPNLAVSLLAVMSAGAVAVPLNPRLTVEEVAVLLGDTRPVAVITDAEHRSRVPDADAARAVVLDLELERDDPLVVSPVRGHLPGASSAAVTPESPALILHTSGTTGRPKGVVLTHRNLLANARQVARAHRLVPGDVALCVLPLFHINGLVVTLLAPLLSGGSVVMPRRFDAERFWSWVEAHGVTWFSAVPTILSRLLSGTVPPPAARAALRFARSASASLPIPVLEEFERRVGVPVIESFGITEAAGQVTTNPLPPARRKPGSVGLAFGNEVRVVDAAGRSLPPGVDGDVAVRGESVFAGYLDRPDADREALRDGWLLTGDLGRLDADGYLFLTGRRKEIINRAGEKISPREVEDVLHRRGEVETACVVGVPDPVYGEEIVAFVALRAGRRLDADALIAHCRAHLAGFKVPRRIFFVSEFPRGPNGKVQRRGLVDAYRALASQGAPSPERNAP
jgi:acyl-CoA synthetase (AMP-forming)/AMP-acid ligase II